MTEERTDRLRSLVPDDPIKVPSDHLACEGCGIAVPTRAVHRPIGGSPG